MIPDEGINRENGITVQLPIDISNAKGADKCDEN
jgi:hypothetical protein